ncbi:MAG: hypothetical protein M0T80_07805 [Actinomycetota bacterium]|nr:hypothetical protein [Actinomycetota bacterium]
MDVEQVAAAAVVADLEGQASAWNLGQVRAAAGRAARVAGIAARVADSPQRATETVDQVEIAIAVLHEAWPTGPLWAAHVGSRRRP